MEHETWTKRLKFAFALSLLIFIDQFSKYIIRQGGGFYICNPNIAFGIHIWPVIFWIFWVTIIVMVGWQLFRTPENRKIQELGLVLILAGALSNIIDRVAFGCVIDFIDLKIWPVFNLADAFIVLGALFWVARRGKIW